VVLDAKRHGSCGVCAREDRRGDERYRCENGCLKARAHDDFLPLGAFHLGVFVRMKVSTRRYCVKSFATSMAVAKTAMR